MSPTLDALAYDDGTFAMVAMDQRESLRTMLAEHGRPDDPTAIAAFKAAVAQHLAPLASGFLIDAGYEAPAEPGLILAVDQLTQERGGPVTDTHLDRTQLDDKALAAAKARGVVALKLLVIWKRDGHEARRLEMAREFVELSRAAGLLSVLEPVAQAAPGEADFELDRAIVAAAEALGPVGPDLYKAQVPSRGIGPADAIVKTCEQLTGILPVPWVVLSNGVARDDFPLAVELACTGGASGTLAGRALWTPALETDDPAPVLAGRCRDRLAEIAAIVHRTARPWHAARPS
ncbi:deoxyribose-phosphate aldolase/phospho-2-dehydro- 3-deoxyheptonate aldolase [Kribbella flavida DSM 17836]|uniref:Deoxyribose-phosphate aldolase/phospho-2-dehydro-3-deoxyheptonate aldolase n=1 Tax=Kribbella flavida (strain DSM 17836 / JCM 10339 / NBRC 14399) TaxID=479435 RepID=D2PXD1_KRIFD|nr:deoxyribose-phosphate aldolase/phospho-2-dehydro- 3-deoxyheptonate aldolase [Kribbella flavida]ADB29779.1 deoxyribose-phosphate aldolase/phospho-2-dehydro- 3-deoxyheptonate aldolase [Kribbella flavida DSM 17836]